MHVVCFVKIKDQPGVTKPVSKFKFIVPVWVQDTSYTFHGKKKRGDSLIERGTSRTPGTEMLSRKMKTSVYMILFIPVVNTADLIEAANDFGWAALTNAAATLARGQDIEVPEIML